MIRLSALLATLLLPTAALAAPQWYYAPTATDFGGGTVEAYAPVIFESPTTLSGAALADAALKELKAVIAEAEAVEVSYKPGAAELEVAADRAGDPNVSDRALGAVYYTLRSAGYAEIRLGGTPLSAGHFTRTAFLPVASLTSALPPNRVDGGFVQVGAEAVPAATFYERLRGGDKAIQGAVQALLKSASGDVKLKLINNIVTFKFKDRDEVAISLLDDGDARVRMAALELLKANGSRNVLKALEKVVDKDGDAEVKLAAVKLLVAAGKKDYEKYLLLDKLKSSDDAVVVAAIDGLVKTGDAAFAPSLAALTAHSNPAVRKAAIEAVRTLKQYPLMIGWLDDTSLNRDVRESAARILADEGGAVERSRGISWLLLEGGVDNAVHAAQTAAKDRVPGTTEALGKALLRDKAEIRIAAAKALGTLKDTAGLEPLAAAFRDNGDADERELFTQQAMEIVGVQPLDQVVRISKSTDVTIRELAIKSLAAFNKDRPNKKAIAVLEAALAEKEPTIRQAAAYALARTPDEAVKAKLVALKGDSDPVVRAQVAHAMATSSHADAEATIMGFLDDRDAEVKVAAIDAARTRNMKGAVDKIKWLVSHRKIEVKRAAMRALVALAEPADSALFDIYAKAMLEQDDKLRILAIEGLKAYSDDTRASQAIGTPLADERAGVAVKITALQALATMVKTDAVEHVARGLFDRDKKVKMAALDALAALKSDKATRPLQEFILSESDPEVKAKAESVLETL